MNHAAVSNEVLLSSLKALLGNERQVVAKVIAYLVEVEARRRHLELACRLRLGSPTRRRL